MSLLAPVGSGLQEKLGKSVTGTEGWRRGKDGEVGTVTEGVPALLCIMDKKGSKSSTQELDDLFENEQERRRVMSLPILEREVEITRLKEV